MSRHKPRYVMLSQALADPFAECCVGGTTSVSGLGGDIDSHFGDVIEDGIVLDKRTCALADIVHGAVAGPMHDGRLPPKSRQPVLSPVEPCDDPTACRALDYVSTDLYLAYWRERGARIGKRKGKVIVWRKGKVIVWEDGTTSPIRNTAA